MVRVCQSSYALAQVGHVRTTEPRTAGWSTAAPAGSGVFAQAAPDSRPSACFPAQITQCG